MSGGGSVNVASPKASSIQIQTSNYGRPITIVYGTTRIAGNLIYYTDFTSKAIKTSSGGKGGSGKVTTGYDYKVAALLGLCEGVLGSITEKTSKQWTYRGYTGSTSYTYTGVRTVYSQQAKYTPAQLALSVYTGAPGQTAFPYVATNHPGEALAYKGLAYVAASSFDLGSSPTMPQNEFEVIGNLANAGSTGIYDARPYDVVVDLLTNSIYGAGLSASMLSDLSGNYLYAAGIWVSPFYDQQAPVADSVKKIAEISNCAFVWSSGVLKWVPYCLDSITGGPGVTLAQGSTPLGTQTYTPGSLAVPVYNLTDDDFLTDGNTDPVIVTRPAPADAFNQVQVKYRNRFNDYAETVAEAKDLAAIEAFGLRPMPPYDAPEICDATVARTVAQHLLQRAQYIRNTYKFKLPYRYVLLDPMDLVTLTESTGSSGLNNTPVRITAISEAEDGTLEVEAEDVVGNVTTVAQYPQQDVSGYSVNYNDDAPAVAAPVIFDAPGRLTATGYELWLAVAQPASPWGGAYVWISLDGSTYNQVGTIYGGARYGTTTASVAAGTDPDTTHSIPIDLSVSAASLSAGSSSDADNASTLCWLDGELIAYSAATLTGTNKYTLGTYIRRGVYGTPNVAHANGASFVRLDDQVFAYAYDHALVGKTVYVKLQSFNLWGGGVQDISTCTAYTHTITGPIGAPSDVTGVTAAPAIGGVQIAWNGITAPDLAEYEVRLGSTWASATLVGRTRSTKLLVPNVATGSTTWLVKAINTTGAYSINAASVTLSVSGPSAPTVTSQVVDNNALIFWTAAASTQPIATYEIRRGATFATATVIGTKSGLFTTVFETVAGTFTYWVVGIDTAGNYGTPGSTTAVISQPPDYVLKSLVTSTFSGTFSNAMKDVDGALVLPVDTATQYQTHFSGNSWASPNDQVTAGKTLFIEPAAASGYYEEFIDTGATIAACKVTVSWSEVDVGTPGVTCSISYSSDNVSYTTLSAATAAYLTNFRYLKIRLTATSSAGLDLARITNFSTRLDTKLRNDAGTVSAVSTDTGGTTVTFAQAFAAVTSITVTPLGTTPITAVYDFSGGANPTSFKVLLFNSSGSRVSGTASWTAKGY